MKITYDPEAQAVYIYLVDTEGIDTFGIVDHTQEITEAVAVDWMKDGTLYGIEILDVESKPLIKEE